MSLEPRTRWQYLVTAMRATYVVPLAGVIVALLLKYATPLVAVLAFLQGYALIVLAFGSLLWAVALLIALLNQVRPPEDDGPEKSGSFYVAGLWITVGILPLLASVITIVFILWGVPKLATYSVGYGLGASLLIWFVILAPCCQLLAGPESANARQCADLKQRRLELDKQLQCDPTLTHCVAESARTQVKDGLIEFDDQLKGRGAQWMRGTGYINLWMLVHRAEEALILCSATETVVSGALSDFLRLKGSKIEQAETIQDSIKQAVTVLKPDALKYLGRDSSTAHSGTPSSASASPSDEMLARLVLRSARQAINQYRDSLWEGIVRARNQLLIAMTAVSLVAYAGLIVLIAGQFPPQVGQTGQASVPASFTDGQRLLVQSIFAALIFFLVGAGVGLFNRLRLSWAAGSAVEDYGLAMTRLLVTPVFSGIAAVLGVLLIGFLQIKLTGINLGPEAPTGQLPALEQIFSLTPSSTAPDNRIGLLLAAVFGLTPELLVQVLQKQTERIKTEISSSELQGSIKS